MHFLYKRREFITLLWSAAAWPLAARAQGKLPRIGFLRQAGPHEKQFDAFRDGLRAAGHVEDQNIVIEQRYAAGAYERLSSPNHDERTGAEFFWTPANEFGLTKVRSTQAQSGL
jgi:hypothetical protein